MKKQVKEIFGSDPEKGGLVTGKHDTLSMLTVLFVFSALYFYLPGNYVFIYQENASLFIYSSDYFQQFAVKTGGLLEYFGNFLSQWYFSFICGSLIVAGVFTIIALIFLKTIKTLFPENILALPLALVPSCLLMLAQLDFNWLMFNNLGLLFSGLAFLISISIKKRTFNIIYILLFPLLYYFLGGYSWIFLTMYIIYLVLTRKMMEMVCLLVVGVLTFFVFRKFIFLQVTSDLLQNPLPVKGHFLYIVVAAILLAPVLLKLFSNVKIKSGNRRQMVVYGTIFLFALTFFVQSRMYNPNSADLFKIEKMFYNQDWEGVIKHQEESQSANFVAQYYYNTALAEKGLLSERLFFSRQDFGTSSLMIPWDSRQTISKIFRGAYFFYAIGLINEAHRWSFESMVVQGYTPENIKLLIKTELINSNFRIAEKYIYVLKRTLHYRKLSKKYELMLYHPDLVKADPELGVRIALQPKEDFPISIKNPQANILLLSQSNPGNRRAFEYKLAWFMLEKNVTGVVDEIAKMKDLGYSRLPRHVEEAAIFSIENIGIPPDLGDFKISQEAGNRFSQFTASIPMIVKNKPSGKSGTERMIRSTFWYYLDLK